MSTCLNDAREYIARGLEQIKASGDDKGIRSARAIAALAWKFWPHLDADDLIRVVKEEALRIGVRGIL